MIIEHLKVLIGMVLSIFGDVYYIIISSKPEEISNWHDFCGKRAGLKPLAVIHSVREKRLEVLPNEKFLEIVAGPWERGETILVPDELLQVVLKLLTG